MRIKNGKIGGLIPKLLFWKSSKSLFQDEKKQNNRFVSFS